MSLKSEIKKLGPWFAIIGIGVGAFGAAKNWPELIWIGVAILILTLFAICIEREIKVRNLKRKISSITKTKGALEARLAELEKILEVSFEDVHNAAHSLRDAIGDLRILESATEAKEKAGLCISDLLSQVAHCLTKITKVECIGSLMLHSGGELKTYQYSSNAPSERKGKQSDSLDPNGGIAGEAFQSGDVVFWNKGDPRFIEIRHNGDRFYESGMTIPFRVGCDYAGLLNIDAKQSNIFSGQCHRMLGAAFADAIGAIS